MSLDALKSVAHRLYFSKALNGPARRLFSLLRPPPYRSARMEFEHEVWSGICLFQSRDGRHIGENNAHPAAYVAQMETRNLPCSFDDSRKGLLINATALRNISGILNDALALTDLQRRHFMQHFRLPDGPLTLTQAYVLSKVSTARPAFMARRAEQPLQSGELDQLHAAFFSLGVGPAGIVNQLIEIGDPRALQTEPMSGDALYKLADECGSLIAPFSGKGCAGSRKLISDYLDRFINGGGPPVVPTDLVRKVFESVGDFDHFYAYVVAYCRLELQLRIAKALIGGAVPGYLKSCRRILSDLGCDAADPVIQLMDADRSDAKAFSRQVIDVCWPASVASFQACKAALGHAAPPIISQQDFCRRVQYSP